MDSGRAAEGYDPPRGFIATANHNINTKGYWPPVGFKTTNTGPFDRIPRLLQVITPAKTFGIEDSKKLQRDVYSLRGAADQKLFRGWKATAADLERARDLIGTWNGELAKDSVPAAIYITWRRMIDGPGGNGEGPAPPAPGRPEIETATQPSTSSRPISAPTGPPGITAASTRRRSRLPFSQPSTSRRSSGEAATVPSVQTAPAIARSSTCRTGTTRSPSTRRGNPVSLRVPSTAICCPSGRRINIFRWRSAVRSSIKKPRIALRCNPDNWSLYAVVHRL